MQASCSFAPTKFHNFFHDLGLFATYISEVGKNFSQKLGSNFYKQNCRTANKCSITALQVV